MKPFRKKKITKNLIIILVITIMLSGLLPNFVQAKTDTDGGGGLLKPIAQFVTYICDGVMQWLQRSFTSMDDIENGDGTYNFQYSPAIIFSGTVRALDINFISPSEEVEKSTRYYTYVQNHIVLYNYNSKKETDEKGSKYKTEYDNATSHEGYFYLDGVVPGQRKPTRL